MLTAPQFSTAGLESVRRRVAAAALLAGRDPAGICLVAVSKQQPASTIRAAHAAGQRDFAENYLQEARPKVAALGDLPITWHFIGHLQANKTREIAASFDWVHSVDRERIAARLDEQRPRDLPRLKVLLQVRVGGDVERVGVDPVALPALVESVCAMPRLELKGLMCMPEPAPDEAARRAPFRRLRELLHELNQRGHSLDALSMGMSGDLEAAIAEGATIVRVGTAIFGPRS